MQVTAETLNELKTNTLLSREFSLSIGKTVDNHFPH